MPVGTIETSGEFFRRPLEVARCVECVAMGALVDVVVALCDPLVSFVVVAAVDDALPSERDA